MDYENADLILYNARVITLEPEQPFAEMVAIKGNRILAVGSKDDLGLLKGDGTRICDCEGGTIIPGFNDAHCHPFSLASTLLHVDCSPKAATSIAEIQACIRRRAQQTEENKWIRAANYDEFYLREKRPPNRWELDQASPKNPVILVHSTGQHCILNGLALQLAGITPDTPNSPGGQIHKDPKTGEPSGLISGRNEQVKRAIPPLDEDEVGWGVKMLNEEYLSHGITSIQDTGWTNGLRNWRAWQRFMNRGHVSYRVSMLVGTESLEEFQSAGLSMGCGDDRLRLGGMKIALDESTGCPNPPQEEINQLALRACKAGFQAAFHIHDVQMLRASLDAIKFVQQQIPETEQNFRLEHCAVCPPEFLNEVKASQAVVVMQPSFLYYMGQQYQEAVLSHQAGWLYPIGSFLRCGIRVAFSSDSPLVTSDPLTGILAAITRKTEAGPELAPEESISFPEALEMYTIGGAYASLEERLKGSISSGKLADLVVLNGDPMEMTPDQLKELRVVRTIIDGKVVWEG